MDDSIHSFFVLPGSEKSSRNNSKSKKNDSSIDKKILNGLSTKTLLNVELKIDDVEDSDEELDSSILSKDKTKELTKSKESEKSGQSGAISKMPKLKLQTT